MQRWAMGVEYDGSAFHGFQRQRHEPRTVQGALEAALSFVADTGTTLVCAGRTDAGVHATAQVIHFDAGACRRPDEWLRGVNSRCPPGVAVQWARQVPPHFSARFSARQRRYTYLLSDAPLPPVIGRTLLSYYRAGLDAAAMQAAALSLVGEHDFSSFRAAGCQARSPVRQVTSFTVRRHGHCVIFEVSANAFLQHMVRNIVGTLMLVGAGQLPHADVARILARRDRRAAGPAAAAAGLYLTQVVYDADYGFAMTPRLPWFLVGQGGLC